jgi:hypothetical protein
MIIKAKIVIRGPTGPAFGRPEDRPVPRTHRAATVTGDWYRQRCPFRDFVGYRELGPRAGPVLGPAEGRSRGPADDDFWASADA